MESDYIVDEEIPEEGEAGEVIENSKKFVSVARSIVDKFGENR